jgi:hypothetical protein
MSDYETIEREPGWSGHHFVTYVDRTTGIELGRLFERRALTGLPGLVVDRYLIRPDGSRLQLYVNLD